jgi:Na+/H+ antiporter NhaA
MSLFTTMLAFDDAPSVGTAEIGILAGSRLAGIVATIILKTIGRS